MKSTVQSVRNAKPRDPWVGVKYPCLIEDKLHNLAIATSSSEGYVIHVKDGNIAGGRVFGNEDSQTWEDAGYTPVIGPRTVTFEN